MPKRNLILSLVCLCGLPTPALAQTIVWTDAAARRIQRKDVNGGSIETIVQFPSPQEAYHVHYDPIGAKFYYLFYAGPGSTFFQRCNLDGSDPENIPTPSTGFFSVGIELRKLYWLTSVATSTFDYSELDGTAHQSHTYPFCCLQIIEAVGDDLFLGTGGTVGKGVWRADADGANEQFVHASGQPLDFAYDPVEDHLYLATDGSIFRMEPDGNGFQEAVSADAAFHVEVDSVGRKVYWIDDADKVIRRANLDGSNVETFVTPADVGLPNFNPLGLTIVYTPPPPIPTLSVWGLAAMSALLVASATLILRRRRAEGPMSVLPPRSSGRPFQAAL